MNIMKNWIKDCIKIYIINRNNISISKEKIEEYTKLKNDYKNIKSISFIKIKCFVEPIKNLDKINTSSINNVKNEFKTILYNNKYIKK